MGLRILCIVPVGRSNSACLRVIKNHHPDQFFRHRRSGRRHGSACLFAVFAASIAVSRKASQIRGATRPYPHHRLIHQLTAESLLKLLDQAVAGLQAFEELSRPTVAGGDAAPPPLVRPA